MTELYAISGLRIKEYEIQGEKITFYAYSSKKSCKCPLCNKLSSRVRSGYSRKLMDLPSGGRQTVIMLKVRRFKCINKKCRRKIFSERYDGYTKPYSRKTDRATDCLSSLLLEVSSSKGSYLSELIQMKQSSSTCLRMISSLPIPVYGDKTIIGIDDFAFRKGISYGSIIVDAENGRPVDLIESRDEPEVTSWLKKHPEINIVTRDRASSYSKAIKTALPSSVQIADRFHIVKNLSERVYDTIKINYPVIKEGYINSLNEQNLSESAEDTMIQTIVEKNKKDELCMEAENEVLNPESEAQRKLEQKEVLYNKIHELHKDGMSSRKIAAAVHVNKETVLKYLKYDVPPKDIIVYRNNYEAYLDIIANEIEHGKNITEIFKRIETEGFKGKLSAFSSWFGKNYPDYKSKNKPKESRKEMTEKKKTEVLFDTLSPRKISIYLSNPTLGIDKAGVPGKEHSLIQKIIHGSPLLQNLKKIMLSFKELLKSKVPELLDEWMENVLLYKMPDINSFIKGLKTDLDAVRNAIIYPWSNGFVEGSVNRLKTKKREMYGRAGFQLLRRKVVLSKMG